MCQSRLNGAVELAPTPAPSDRGALADPVGERGGASEDRWSRETAAFLDRMEASPEARRAYEEWFRTRRGPARASDRSLPAGAVPRLVRREDLAVACYTWGRGPAVLLVHGLGGNADQLARFVQPLGRAGYRAVAIDVPGHGESDGRATDVYEVERALHLVQDAVGPLHGVVAFSLGCTWSLWALSRGLAAERVVCISPVARQRFLYETFVRRHALSAEVAGELARLHHARYGPFEVYDTATLCRSLHAPALILHDHGDAMIPPREGGARLAEAWKGSTFVLTRGLRHFGMVRDAAVVGRVVRFLSEAS